MMKHEWVLPLASVRNVCGTCGTKRASCRSSWTLASFCFFSSQVSFSDIQARRARVISSSIRKPDFSVALIVHWNSPKSWK